MLKPLLVLVTLTFSLNAFAAEIPLNMKQSAKLVTAIESGNQLDKSGKIISGYPIPKCLECKTNVSNLKCQHEYSKDSVCTFKANGKTIYTIKNNPGYKTNPFLANDVANILEEKNVKKADTQKKYGRIAKEVRCERKNQAKAGEAMKLETNCVLISL